MIHPVDILPPEQRASAAALGPLLVRIGAALLRYGCATPRIETCLMMTAECHGHPATVFAVPTGLWMTVGVQGGVQMARVDGSDVDLGRLAELDHIFNDLASGKLRVEDAHAVLDALEGRRRSVGRVGLSLAGAGATGSTAVLFGGGLTALWVAAVLGAVLATVIPMLDRSRRIRPLTELAVGLITGLCSWLAVSIDPETARKPLILAGIILVVPGLTLTAGLSDLVERNLVAASARLMAAFRTLVLLVFGVALAFTLEATLDPSTAINISEVAVRRPGWILAAATLVGASAFAIFFGVARRDFIGAVLAGGIAWSSASFAAQHVESPAMSAFLGALAVGLFANFMARLTERPAQIYLLSGIVMLVPGTLSFLSFEQLLSGAVNDGTAGLVSTFFSAGALAVGVVLANAALPARKVL